MSVFRFRRELDRLQIAGAGAGAERWQRALAYAGITQQEAEKSVADFADRLRADLDKILATPGQHPWPPLARLLMKRQRRLCRE
jgi:hypothetical protein